MSKEPNSLVLGTRGSALALAQAAMTEEALAAAVPGLEVERRIIRTTGDRRTDVPLAEVAKSEGHLDKGVFIKELEVALATGEIDLAVHSLKDVPSDLEEGFELAAVLPRAAAGDVLVTRGGKTGLAGLPDGATVATSSVRRQRQLLLLRPDLEVVDLRGNVPTRLRKLATQPELDGIVLAAAGLARLGYTERIEVEGTVLEAEEFDPQVFLPAAGQGAVALEIRAGDGAVRSAVEALNCVETMDAVAAERAFLLRLGAGCETPVGVLSRIEGDRLHLRARVFEEGEAQPLEGEAEGPRNGASALAAKLVDRLQRRTA